MMFLALCIRRYGPPFGRYGDARIRPSLGARSLFWYGDPGIARESEPVSRNHILAPGLRPVSALWPAIRPSDPTDRPAIRLTPAAERAGADPTDRRAGGDLGIWYPKLHHDNDHDTQHDHDRRQRHTPEWFKRHIHNGTTAHGTPTARRPPTAHGSRSHLPSSPRSSGPLAPPGVVVSMLAWSLVPQVDIRDEFGNLGSPRLALGVSGGLRRAVWAETGLRACVWRRGWWGSEVGAGSGTGMPV